MIFKPKQQENVSIVFSPSGGFNLLKVFELKGDGAGSSAVKEKVEVKEVLNRLRENDFKVDWTGEAFKVKPMVLYRVVHQYFILEIEVLYYKPFIGYPFVTEETDPISDPTI